MMILIWLVITGILIMAATAISYNCGRSDGYDDAVIENKKPVIAPVKIECLCGHGPNFHIDGGRCDQTIQWNVYGVGKMDWTKQTKCRCKKYTGPEFQPTIIDRIELELTQ
jgi:hypothetical protein